DDPGKEYFAINTLFGTGTFTWKKPDNVTNKDAKRDFTFTYFRDKNANGIFDADETLDTLKAHIVPSTWWIETVEWVKNPDGNPLIGMWTEGKSIYADKDTPTAVNNYKYVDVVVTVGGTLPTGGGTVTLAKIDPPNECVPDGYLGDNYSDTFSFVTSSTLTFTPGQTAKTTTVSVDTHAGNNNYIIKATANNGEPDNVEKSEQLTVWRRLWVELDQMAKPTETPADGFAPANKGNGQGQWNTAAPTPEPDDFDVLFQPQKPDISVLTAAMVAACITVQEVNQTSANASWIIGDSASQHPGAWDTTTPFVHNLADPATDSPAVGGLSRDVNINNASFWCIQGVGAYEARAGKNGDGNGDDWDWGDPRKMGNRPLLGNATHGSMVFLIFQETIRDFSESGLDDSGVKKCRRTAEEINQIGTFHEVLHFFGFIDKGTGYNPAVDGEIMALDWLYTESISPSVLTLSPAQIKQIQRKDFPS
ncbi:MAG: hypothetical protein FWC50_05670, partial [Planctomycetaceae bacterium]|nr:hypothetical protein [Planctomycetaceae bacterium]